MSAKLHYAARRLAGETIIGSMYPLCGIGALHGKTTGHVQLVSCARCKHLLAQRKTFRTVTGKVLTLEQAQRLNAQGVRS